MPLCHTSKPSHFGNCTCCIPQIIMLHLPTPTINLEVVCYTHYTIHLQQLSRWMEYRPLLHEFPTLLLFHIPCPLPFSFMNTLHSFFTSTLPSSSTNPPFPLSPYSLYLPSLRNPAPALSAPLFATPLKLSSSPLLFSPTLFFSPPLSSPPLSLPSFTNLFQRSILQSLKHLSQCLRVRE